MKAFALALLLSACGGPVQHCPPHTATVALTCKEAVARGEKTKEQCYQLIEESCP